MATFQQRGKTWRVMVRRQGQSISATFDRKRDAQSWALATEAAVAKGNAPLDARKARSLTVAGLMHRYAAEVSPTKRGARWEQIRITALAAVDDRTGVARYPAFHTPVVAFTPRTAAEWRDGRLREVSAYTVNRELNLLSAIFRQALKEWQVVESNPIRAIVRPENPRPRTRRVSIAERQAIAAQLGWNGTTAPATSSQWVAWAYWLACETAMRKGEILSIQRQHVHEKHVHLVTTKNGDERDVPLSSAARAILALVPAGRKDERLAPISPAVCDVLFRRARTKAGLPDLRFHDSRREAYTTLAGKLSVLELMRAAGHRSDRSVQTYYAPDIGEMADKLG